ncbi:uncharacterized protein BJ171DRAFT_112042 [Polychytrium aggregatum]|uniref:uncharacterized protein n=1 Tax=Polychytrium aggregatum TaxID=110093 RepID=UPI0022FEEE42|nr:uncharacterized protein BJ171DRAFT_112042 [Polychytrium aggregatum]KAI9209261.1 hypothetical protein BJ171DRAFT_112042 [Polychytrium aggregatum]
MQIDDSLRPHLAPSNDCFALPPSSFQPQFLVPVPNSQKDIAADLGKSISPPSQEPRLSRSYESAASARTLSSSGTTLVSAPSAKFDATFHIADYVTYVIHRIWFPTKPAVELPGKLVHTIHRLITIPNVPEASPHHINFSLHLLTRLKQLKPSATFTAKLFLIALIVSHKFLTDLTLRNSSWAKRANVHVDEINRGEMAFLADLNYNLFGEPHFYQSWLLTLRSLKEDWMIERLSPHRQLSIRSASTPLFTTPPAPVSSRSYPPPIPVTSGAASSSTGFLLPPSATRVITASPGEVAVSPGEIAVSPAAISPGESSAANPSHSMQSTLSVPSIAIPAIQVTVPLNSINPDVDMSFYPKPDLAFTKSDSDTTLLPPSPARTASSTTTGGGNSDLATMMDLEMEEPTPKVPRRFFTVQ